MKRFELIEHTADVGIKAYGKNPHHLFSNSAYGMFSLITDLSTVSPKEKIGIKLTSLSREELLIAWLNELLYHFNQSKILLKKFNIKELNGEHLLAEVFGERYDKKKHRLKMEVKAATYHQLKIEQVTNNRWQAKIIFDV